MNLADRITDQIFRLVLPLFADSESVWATSTNTFRPAIIDRATNGLRVFVAGTSPTLGTTFRYARATISTISTSLPNVAFPDGFILTNLGPQTLFIEQEAANATLTSYELGPGERISIALSNPNVLKAVTRSATANIQLGGVV